MDRAQLVDEVRAERVLEGDPAGLDPAWDEQDLLVLHVHAFHRTNPLRKRELLGRRERLGREPLPPFTVPDHRRVEALLDRGPDREDRREGVALDAQVAAVPHVDLVDLVEEVLGRVGGEDIGQSRIHAHAQQREASAGAPGGIALELLVAKLHAGMVVGVVSVWPREAVGHVHVVDASGKRPLEDGHHEPRIDSIHHQVRLVASREVGHGTCLPRIDALD